VDPTGVLITVLGSIIAEKMTAVALQIFELLRFKYRRQIRVLPISPKPEVVSSVETVADRQIQCIGVE